MTIHPGDASNNAVKGTFFKDSSEFLTAKASGQGNRTVVFKNRGNQNGGNGSTDFENFNLHFIDDPSTTSQLTYDVRMSNTSNTTVRVNQVDNPDNISQRPCGLSTITLMEIDGS